MLPAALILRLVCPCDDKEDRVSIIAVLFGDQLDLEFIMISSCSDHQKNINPLFLVNLVVQNVAEMIDLDQ